MAALKLAPQNSCFVFKLNFGEECLFNSWSSSVIIVPKNESELWLKNGFMHVGPAETRECKMKR